MYDSRVQGTIDKSDWFAAILDPSFELELKYNDKWLELLGSGLLQPQVLANGDLPDHCGWAFGIGYVEVEF